MGVKLTAARSALAAGVPEVLVADGRVSAPVSRALAGAATRISLPTLTRAAPAQSALMQSALMQGGRL
jgi:acetylglutamate/LysW-gamma-L-alpha-aminoadipate kinase